VGITGIATKTIPKFLDPLPGGSKLVDGIEFVVSWARANSLWPLVYGTACCAMEMMSTGSSRHDWARFGVEVARATPRQADLIVLAGTIVEKMGKRLITLYEQMPGPKYVIAMGSCAISGGPFYYDSYSVIKGGDRLIPVDVYIPGCPPRPEALLYGIMQLQKKIRTEGRRNPWQIGAINTAPFVDTFTEAKEAWHATEKQKRASRAASEVQAGSGKAAPPKPVRVMKQTFEEIVPRALFIPGLAEAQILARVQAVFPEVRCADAVDEEGSKPSADQTIMELMVAQDRYIDLVRFLKSDRELDMDLLLQISAIDWQDRFDVVVHLLSTVHGHKIFLRCPVERDNPVLESLTSLYQGAEWHEREVYDLFGIEFANHPDLRRLFLEDDFRGHPLRKDFEDPTRVVRRPY
jgi:NADH-quinone oxidoreductase B subunit/NADH/F420H2 dehydrogenase subunit C